MLYLKLLLFMYTYLLRKVWSGFVAEDLFVEEMGLTEVLVQLHLKFLGTVNLFNWQEPTGNRNPQVG